MFRYLLDQWTIQMILAILDVIILVHVSAKASCNIFVSSATYSLMEILTFRVKFLEM